MIIGKDRDKVIENIRTAVRESDFNRKVEVSDPVLTEEEKKRIIRRHIRRLNTPMYNIWHCAASAVAGVASFAENRKTVLVDAEKIKNIPHGAIITSNHFNPMDNTVIRTLIWKTRRKEMLVVGQESNLAMSGLFGFMMNYAGIIPISTQADYIMGDFMKLLGRALKSGRDVLIYPEQEMWFNYRKPRPLKRGAYYFASKLGVPVISCFTAAYDMNEMQTEEFHKIRYVCYVLDPIYPDPGKNVRENSVNMCMQDMLQKKRAYERAYGKPLDYTFKNEDIAGWICK